jgi:SepF-like predicted cell division protein (DUF552 family)
MLDTSESTTSEQQQAEVIETIIGGCDRGTLDTFLRVVGRFKHPAIESGSNWSVPIPVNEATLEVIKDIRQMVKTGCGIELIKLVKGNSSSGQVCVRLSVQHVGVFTDLAETVQIRRAQAHEDMIRARAAPVQQREDQQRSGCSKRQRVQQHQPVSVVRHSEIQPVQDMLSRFSIEQLVKLDATLATFPEQIPVIEAVGHTARAYRALFESLAASTESGVLDGLDSSSTHRGGQFVTTFTLKGEQTIQLLKTALQANPLWQDVRRERAVQDVNGLGLQVSEKIGLQAQLSVLDTLSQEVQQMPSMGGVLWNSWYGMCAMFLASAPNVSGLLGADAQNLIRYLFVSERAGTMTFAKLGLEAGDNQEVRVVDAQLFRAAIDHLLELVVERIDAQRAQEAAITQAFERVGRSFAKDQISVQVPGVVLGIVNSRLEGLQFGSILLPQTDQTFGAEVRSHFMAGQSGDYCLLTTYMQDALKAHPFVVVACALGVNSVEGLEEVGLEYFDGNLVISNIGGLRERIESLTASVQKEIHAEEAEAGAKTAIATLGEADAALEVEAPDVPIEDWMRQDLVRYLEDRGDGDEVSVFYSLWRSEPEDNSSQVSDFIRDSGGSVNLLCKILGLSGVEQLREFGLVVRAGCIYVDNYVVLAEALEKRQNSVEEVEVIEEVGPFQVGATTISVSVQEEILRIIERNLKTRSRPGNYVIGQDMAYLVNQLRDSGLSLTTLGSIDLFINTDEVLMKILAVTILAQAGLSRKGNMVVITDWEKASRCIESAMQRYDLY